jgi:aminoglycoside phosphotransferase (APT) family kinase protein
VITTVEDGWDSLVLDIGGEWIVRIARRPEVRETTAVEARLLPELPGPVPRFEHVSAEAVAYRKLQGSPIDSRNPALGAAVGHFLSALHAFPVERARELGVPEPPWRDTYAMFIHEVLDAAELGPEAEAMVSDFLDNEASFAFEPALIHADLGPEHLLATGDELTGVIDWGDVRIGDPALDFAWLLQQPFADAVLAAYGVADAGLRERALFYHRLGPWNELHYGLYFNRPELVESGLAGVRSRLPGGLP